MNLGVKSFYSELKAKDQLQMLSKEIAVMKKLNHPNVIRLHEVLDDDEFDKVYLIMDYAAGGQIIEWNEENGKFFLMGKFKECGKIPEKDLKTIFRQSLKAINYRWNFHLVHSTGIVHRDIKPQNLLLDSHGNVKVGDFGVSAMIDSENDQVKGTEGTYYFMPPEVFSQNKKTISGKKTDIWALGITFFAFTHLSLPFNGANIDEFMHNILNQELVFPEENRANKFIAKILEKNPEKRLSIEDLANDFWLNEGETNLSNEMLLFSFRIKDSGSIFVSEEDILNALNPIEQYILAVHSLTKKKVSKKMKALISKHHDQDNNSENFLEKTQKGSK